MTVDHNGHLERYADDSAGASEGQAVPIYQLRYDDYWEDVDGETWMAYVRDEDKRVLYTHPSAEIAALRERIAGMEKAPAELTERERFIWTLGHSCGMETAAERCMSILGYPPREYYAKSIRALIEGASSEKEDGNGKV